MKRVGVSELRKMTVSYLRDLKEPLEICSANEPLRVLIPYKQYMTYQELYLASQRAEKYMNNLKPLSGVK